MKIKLNFKLDELNLKRAKHFFDIYEPVRAIHDMPRRFFLGNKEPRKCRFCNGTKEKGAKFSKDAHVISHFMGNKNLLSYFECNECNEKFNPYENSFANFIGVNRTFLGVKSQTSKKIPKHKDLKERIDVFANNKEIYIDVQENKFKNYLDEETKTLNIPTQTQPFIPIHIPKLITKIGLSILEENELSDYKEALDFLIQEKEKDILFENNKFLNVPMCFINGFIEARPIALLFNKKSDREHILAPQKQVVIKFGNFIFQMALPFGKRDRQLLEKEFKRPLFPLDKSHIEEFGNSEYSLYNFSSCKQIVYHEKLCLSYDSMIEKD